MKLEREREILLRLQANHIRPFLQKEFDRLKELNYLIYNKMNIAEYRQHTLRTLPDLGSPQLNLSHMALGLAGEIGELVECVGTELKFNEVNRPNIVEELGDLYWYLANYCNMQEIDLPENPVFTETDDECLDLLIVKISNLVDLVKRYMAYNKSIEKVKEIEAIYDIRVALVLFENVYDLDGDEIRSKNIAKLKARYPQKFDENLAVNRDIAVEKKAME